MIDWLSLGLSVAMALTAGLVGCFAVMRRMTLAADAVSHVALPGIGIALALHVYPFFGAVAMLLLGALAIWALESRAGLATETVIGVVFTAALAVGSLTTSGEELIDALLGGGGALSAVEAYVGFFAAFAIVAFVLRARHALVLSLVSSDIAHASGVRVERLNLAFWFVFALTIALGLRFLGVLLMGSLIIIPAATARRMAASLSGMMVLSPLLAIVATLGGTVAAQAAGLASGPVIACVAVGIFMLSFAPRHRDVRS